VPDEALVGGPAGHGNGYRTAMRCLAHGLLHIAAVCAGIAQRLLEETDPVTGTVITEVPRMGAAETVRAIQAAEAAGAGWRALSSNERGELLRRWAGLMISHREELARLMVREQGKPLAEAMCHEETFGPVAAVQRFTGEGEAVRLANDVRPYADIAVFVGGSAVKGPRPICSRTGTTVSFVRVLRCQLAPSTTRVWPLMKPA
jgi:acyl-CoA reductase-like NAD-dependent aldehyde dehydrogenase